MLIMVKANAKSIFAHGCGKVNNFCSIANVADMFDFGLNGLKCMFRSVAIQHTVTIAIIEYDYVAKRAS